KRLDIFEKAQTIARDLGGSLVAPTLPWKYAWIRKAFGQAAAERMAVLLPTVRWSAARLFDQIVWYAERALGRTEREIASQTRPVSALDALPESQGGDEGKGRVSSSLPPSWSVLD